MDGPYEELRPLLFSIAYRMLGSVSEAEDIVQETFLRFHRASTAGEEIRSPKAFLSVITTRLAIDHLRSARVRRERYVGTWLPEPLVTESEPDAVEHAADSLSLAFLVLLESLSPVERAVFLLRDVFEYDYAEIAQVVGKSQDNCRQLAVRARRHVEARRPRFQASRQKRQELARRFFDAAGHGDRERLIRLLSADVVAYGDGGGKAPAFPQPVYGRDRVGHLVIGLKHRRRLPFETWRPAWVNGQPGGLFFDSSGRPVLLVALDIADDVVQAVRAISNPDKLRHLASSTGPDTTAS